MRLTAEPNRSGPLEAPPCVARRPGNPAHPLLRLLPSLTDVALVLPAALLFGSLRGAQTLLADGDTGWHLRAGEWMLANRRVPDSDLFSFTRPGEPWFAWEWLWDVIFAWLHGQWGMGAVLAGSLLVLSLTFALLFRLVRRSSGNALVAIAITFLAVAVSSNHWLARPHLFTLLLTVVFLTVLERAREGETRRLWLLPLLTLPWVNLHGGFLVGLALTGAYALGEGPAGRGRPYLVTAAGCLAASLVNPYGWRLHAHLLAYLTDHGHHAHIAEFQPINYASGMARFFELLLLLAAGAALWSLYRRRFTHALLLAGWAHLALTAARHLSVFAVVAAPLVGLCLKEWIAALPRTGWLTRLAGKACGLDAIDRLPRAYAAGAITLAAVTGLLFDPQAPAGFRPLWDAGLFPVQAVEMLRRAEPDEAIFTSDDWGDYLIYRLYPGTKVFVDGRSDFYGPQFGREYRAVLHARPGWHERLERYGVRLVLISPEAPVAGALRESPRWRTVYDDGVAILFRATGEPAGNRVNGRDVRLSGPSIGGRKTAQIQTTRS